MSQFLVTILARMERKSIESRLSSGYQNYRKYGDVVGRKQGYRKSHEDMQVQYAEEIKMLRKDYNYQVISQITNTNKNTLTKLRRMFIEA